MGYLQQCRMHVCCKCTCNIYQKKTVLQATNQVLKIFQERKSFNMYTMTNVELCGIKLKLRKRKITKKCPDD